MKILTAAEIAKGKAEWAERKAGEAAASNYPWAMGNLRTYQNLAFKFWGEHFAAVRAELNDAAKGGA